jgi:hypothetical protein
VGCLFLAAKFLLPTLHAKGRWSGCRYLYEGWQLHRHLAPWWRGRLRFEPGGSGSLLFDLTCPRKRRLAPNTIRLRRGTEIGATTATRITAGMRTATPALQY